MKNKKIAKKQIQKCEHISFLRNWFHNTKEEITFLDVDTLAETKIKQESMRNFLEEFLRAYEANKSYKIVGADIMKDFEVSLSTVEDLLKVSQHMWDNPKHYYKLNDMDNAYYEFLKFLWIEAPGFPEETRLTDIVNTGSEDGDIQKNILTHFNTLNNFKK